MCAARDYLTQGAAPAHGPRVTLNGDARRKARGDTRKTETDKDWDRQRQTDTETDKKRDKETERQRDRETERQRDREREAMFRHVQRGVQRCAEPTESADLELTEWPAAQSAQQSAQ
jgi:hypothetical protein